MHILKNYKKNDISRKNMKQKIKKLGCFSISNKI